MTWKRNVPRGFSRITRGVVNVLTLTVPASSATPPEELPFHRERRVRERALETNREPFSAEVALEVDGEAGAG